jgi:hypothetical protein
MTNALRMRLHHQHLESSQLPYNEVERKGRTVFFFDTFDGETQRVAIEAESRTVRFTDMKGHVGGVVVGCHGHFYRHERQIPQATF